MCETPSVLQFEGWELAKAQSRLPPFEIAITEGPGLLSSTRDPQRQTRRQRVRVFDLLAGRRRQRREPSVREGQGVLAHFVT